MDKEYFSHSLKHHNSSFLPLNNLKENLLMNRKLMRVFIAGIVVCLLVSLAFVSVSKVDAYYGGYYGSSIYGGLYGGYGGSGGLYGGFLIKE